MGQSKYNRDLARIVENFTSDYSLEVTRGQHIKITLRRAGKSRFVMSPLTSGDNDILKIMERKIRRTWEELKGSRA